MTSIHPSELDSNATDSVTSSPRSDHHFNLSNDPNARVRLMCSFGGKILPRPHDNQLRYVGGDTRIVAVHRSTSFSHFLSKLSKLSGTMDMTIKYQLPNEDLDALISVTTDEDIENMMEEYDRFIQNHHNPRSARLRLFLFPKNDQESRASSINSLFGGSTNRDHWFLDALNGGGPGSELERGRSEVSSIISEVPDFLFGLDNQEDPTVINQPKTKTRFKNNSNNNNNNNMSFENVSVSDPGSPVPVVSSESCVNSMPNLPPVKTRMEPTEKLEKQIADDQTGFVENREPVLQFSQPGGYGPNQSNPMMHYFPAGTNYSPHHHQPVVYYLPGQIPTGNVPVHHIPVQTPAQYVQQYPGHVYHQHPVTVAGQVYGGGMAPVSNYDPHEVAVAARTGSESINQQQMYYGGQNTAYVYSGMMGGVAEEGRGSGMETKAAGRVSP